MKALEYLKALKVDNSKFPCTVDEAIAELEALQAPKTCDGCVKEQLKIDNGGACPFWCSRDFTQDQYKPKDNQ